MSSSHLNPTLSFIFLLTTINILILNLSLFPSIVHATSPFAVSSTTTSKNRPTAVYDTAQLRRGTTLRSSCDTANKCTLSFYQRGRLSTLDDIADQCWKQCHGLRVDCDLACYDAVSIDEVDTNAGCGCFAPPYAAKQAVHKCKAACRKGVNRCIATCKKGRLMNDGDHDEKSACEMDDESNVVLAIDMDWDFKVNGTCEPICGSTKSCSALKK